MNNLGRLVAGVGVGLLTVVVHPAVPLVLVAGATLAWLVLTNAFASLILFVTTLYLRPAEFFPALAPLRPSLVLAVASIGVLFAANALHGVPPRRRVATDLPIGLLAAAVALSCARSTDFAASFDLVSNVFSKILVLYVLILSLVATPGRVRTFQISRGVLCAVLAIYATFGTNPEGAVEGGRSAAIGLLGDPNDLAFVLVAVAPFLLAATSRTRGRRRYLFGLLASLVLLGILSTQSRGGLLGLCASVYFLARGRVRARWVPIAVAVICLGGLYAVSGIEGRESGGHSDSGELDESAQGRLDAWKAGGRMLLRNPVTGVGIGQFASNYERYASEAVIWGKHETHNAYIKAGAETGLPGGVAFVAFLVAGVCAARRLARKAPELVDPIDRAAAESALPGLVAVMVTAFFLSQTWSWFLYLAVATTSAMDRVWSKSTR